MKDGGMNSHEPVRRVRLDANCSSDVGPDREPGLAHLVVGLTAVFVFTSLTLGAPPVPISAPVLRTAVDIEMLVRSPSTDQLAAGLVLLTWAIWLGWGLLVATTLLRVLAVVTESVTSEAAWARSFRTVSDVVTLPWVRRAVDASLAGTLFLRVSAATFAADKMAVAPAVVQAQSHDRFWRTVPEAPGHWQTVEPGQPAYAPELGTSDVPYTVERGDSLGKIADRFYGTWAAYKRIYEANAGREQPDGRTPTSWPHFIPRI